uniref:SAM-dependent MTase RsmB/NOP-type domain-containing protein n=1 Tax=Kalanchoe fedtschenkoi TaxID=63787 RepID=A0A7N0V4D5_KALFE
MEEATELPLPDAYLKFLKDSGIDPSIYTAAESTPRYIRLKPDFEEYVQEIEAELGCDLKKVEWLPYFYSLPPHVQIASSKAYREGKIYGIDAASGAAVAALGIVEGDHVLDLCAAPGAKLCMMLDLLGSSGSVTGVDVASHRLAACRTMLRKYALGARCRLFVADGTKFSVLPVTTRSESESALDGDPNVFKEWTSKRSYKDRKRSRERKGVALSLASRTQDPELIFYGKDSGVIGLNNSVLYRTASNDAPLSSGYDKVLVDAECTHDGSVKHILKFENWGWKTLERRVLDAERSDDLAILQQQLLFNGFRLLKVGGSLVYSTCSLTLSQNEDVVKQFLLDNASAELQVIEAAKNWPCKVGNMPMTLRFDPLTSQTSGLFVAKFRKLF